MDKMPLSEWVTGNNDYSVFAVKSEFNKYPLKEIAEDTGEYHKVKVAEAFQALRALNALTLEEYFRYKPECIEDLTGLPSLNEYTYNDLSAMTMDELFRLIGFGMDTDYCPEYTAADERTDACCILIDPVIDSGYTHPLFFSSFKHNRDLIYDDYTAEDIAKKEFLKNLNTFIRDIMSKSASAGQHLNAIQRKRIYDGFFNNIIRPAIAVSKGKCRFTPIYSTTD